jgi:membrane fusion protein (multidrug efflux system)
MKLKLTMAGVLVLLVLGGLAGIKTLQIRKLMASGQGAAAPVETVSTFAAREEHWQGSLTAIGSVTAAQGVTVTTEIPGLIRQIAFESGAVVEKEALLIRLDTSSEEAQLRAVEAQVELAKLNAERLRSLRKEKTVSQSDLDTAEANLKQNQANGDAIRSTIEKKTIRAPFAGRLGIRLVNLGQYLDPGKPVVSLQSLSPIYVEFALPQQELAKLKSGLRLRLTTDAYVDRCFEGILTALNPDLDVATRSVGLQGTIENAGQLLRPGMFARVQVLLPEQQNVLVIPVTAVLSAPYGDSVYVVEPNPGKDAKGGLKVRQQFVRVGRAQGDFVSIETGLKPGERVVSTGVFKLRNGMAVIENNTLVPKTERSPRPEDS